jgi:hypothetical protein
VSSNTAAADRAAQAHERTSKRLRSKAASQSKSAAAKLSRTLKRTHRRSRGASPNAGSWNQAGKTVSLLFKKHRGSVIGDAYSLADKTAQHIASNMLGRTPQQRLEEFKLDCRRHPAVSPENLIVHISLSRPEGHSLSLQQWQEVGKTWLKNIDAEGCNYTITRHPDKHDHAHLVYSRARTDGTLVSDSNDFWRGRAAAREAACALGIEVADIAPKPTQAPTDRAVSAMRRSQRRGTPSAWVDPKVVGRAILRAKSFEDLPALLQAEGVEFKLAQSQNGVLMRAQGAHEWLAGSSINRNFSLPAIQRQIELNAQRANGVTPQRPPTPIPNMRPAQPHIQATRQRGG